MRLLLDTHALLWWLAGRRTLPTAARRAIADADAVVVSAVSLWEIALKRQLGKLRAPDDLQRRLLEQGFQLLAIAPEHAWAGGALPLHHRDPFDRLLVAQAQLEGLTLVTRDPAFGRYGVPLLPA